MLTTKKFYTVTKSSKKETQNFTDMHVCKKYVLFTFVFIFLSCFYFIIYRGCGFLFVKKIGGNKNKIIQYAILKPYLFVLKTIF